MAAPASGSLSAEVRQGRIRDLLARAGQVRIADLASDLDVSEMTVRRDLDALAAAGAVRRVRGGALPVGPRPFADRVERQPAAKAAIAAKLAPLLVGVGAVGFDASSTVQRLAAGLAADGGLAADTTVVTNGPDTFRVLQAVPRVDALLTGGRLDPRTGSLVGPLATRAVAHLVLGRLFVSAAGVAPSLGSTEAALEEAEVKLALAEVAAEVVLAVDHTKLGAVDTARCLGWEAIDLLVTDLDPDDARLDPYRDRVALR